MISFCSQAVVVLTCLTVKTPDGSSAASSSVPLILLEGSVSLPVNGEWSSFCSLHSSAGKEAGIRISVGYDGTLCLSNCSFSDLSASLERSERGASDVCVPSEKPFTLENCLLSKCVA